MPSRATPDDVGEWMRDAFSVTGTLRRADAAKGIETRFGAAFTHRDENGNRAVDANVLGAFRRLTAGEAVWDRCTVSWRRRDAPKNAGVRTRPRARASAPIDERGVM